MGLSDPCKGRAWQCYSNEIWHPGPSRSYMLQMRCSSANKKWCRERRVASGQTLLLSESPAPGWPHGRGRSRSAWLHGAPPKHGARSGHPKGWLCCYCYFYTRKHNNSWLPLRSTNVKWCTGPLHLMQGYHQDNSFFFLNLIRPYTTENLIVKRFFLF